MGMLGLAPPQGLPVSAGGSGTGTVTTVQDEGVDEAVNVVKINFEGAGVTAVDAGGGIATITIPGATADPASVIPLIFAFGDLT